MHSISALLVPFKFSTFSRPRFENRLKIAMGRTDWKPGSLHGLWKMTFWNLSMQPPETCNAKPVTLSNHNHKEKDWIVKLCIKWSTGQQLWKNDILVLQWHALPFLLFRFLQITNDNEIKTRFMLILIQPINPFFFFDKVNFEKLKILFWRYKTTLP